MPILCHKHTCTNANSLPFPYRKVLLCASIIAIVLGSCMYITFIFLINVSAYNGAIAIDWRGTISPVPCKLLLDHCKLL